MRRAGVLVATALAGLAGSPAAARTATQVGPPPPASHLLVTATEFRLGLSRAAVRGGPAAVQLSNRGQDAHDLVVRRLDRHGRATGAAQAVTETQAGGLATARFFLRPGHYVLFCSLPGHRARGMQARLTVHGG